MPLFCPAGPGKELGGFQGFGSYRPLHLPPCLASPPPPFTHPVANPCPCCPHLPTIPLPFPAHSTPTVRGLWSGALSEMLEKLELPGALAANRTARNKCTTYRVQTPKSHRGQYPSAVDSRASGQGGRQIAATSLSLSLSLSVCVCVCVCQGLNSMLKLRGSTSLCPTSSANHEFKVPCPAGGRARGRSYYRMHPTHRGSCPASPSTLHQHTHCMCACPTAPHSPSHVSLQLRSRGEDRGLGAGTSPAAQRFRVEEERRSST